MRGTLLELFWMPNESVRWLRGTAHERDLWMVMWKGGSPAREISAGELSADMLCDTDEDTIHFFLGLRDLQAPVWRESNGRRHIDFPKSYATQFVPPVLAPGQTTLLEGRAAIFDCDKYEDSAKADKLASFFDSLRTSMKKHSDQRRIVVQDLASGTLKKHPGKLVGSEVPDDGSLALKQFVLGPVSFRIEPRSP
jgi:hypothetical protein